MGNIFGCLRRRRGCRNDPQYYFQYPGYCPPPPQAVPMPLPAPYDHHRRHHPSWVGGRYPCRPSVAHPPPIHCQKAVLIRNDVNVKKDTLRIDADEENPGKFVVSFTFDASADGSITIAFFAKEGDNCGLIPMKVEILPPVTVQFQQGLGQKFRQPSGTGIDFSKFEEKEFLIEGDTEVFPLEVKAKANSSKERMKNSQITLFALQKDKSEYKVKLVKQILRVNGMRYELQDIYGFGNSLEGDVDGDDAGKECVICLSGTPPSSLVDSCAVDVRRC